MIIDLLGDWPILYIYGGEAALEFLQAVSLFVYGGNRVIGCTINPFGLLKFTKFVK
jgi:hypothetical protein